MIHVTYTCKKCQEEIEVEVTIGEEDDLPEKCENCGEPIPDSAHGEVEEDAIGQAQDSAEDWSHDG